MKIVFRAFSLIIMILLFSACSTSPTDDDKDFIDPEYPTGPGIFSGDDGKFTIFKFPHERKKEEAEKQQGVQPGYYQYKPGQLPAMSADSFEEFQAFQRWLRAREPGSENYQEYQDWRAYQQYLRFKEQQQAQPAPTQSQ